MKASPILLLAATTLHLASPALSWNPFGWLGHHKHPSFSYTCEKSIHPYFNPGKMTEVLNAACPAGLPEEGSAEGPVSVEIFQEAYFHSTDGSTCRR